MSSVARDSGYTAPAPTSGLAGRRRRSRLRVRLSARMITRTETVTVVLNDLSINGAQISTTAALRVGCEVLLQWATYEAFGEVVWCGGGRCGISFFDPITQAEVLATRALDETAHLAEDKELARQSARQWVEGTSRY